MWGRYPPKGLLQAVNGNTAYNNNPLATADHFTTSRPEKLRMAT